MTLWSRARTLPPRSTIPNTVGLASRQRRPRVAVELLARLTAPRGLVYLDHPAVLRAIVEARGRALGRAEELARPLDHHVGALLGDEVPAALDCLYAHVVGVGLEAFDDRPAGDRVRLATDQQRRHRIASRAMLAPPQARQLPGEEGAVDVGGGKSVIGRAEGLGVAVELLFAPAHA